METALVTGGAVMVGLGLLLSVALAFANKKLYVYEDPRIEAVDSMLPQANCGACGFPGCRAMAEKLVSGETNPSKCTVSNKGTTERIASYLGVPAGHEEKRVARLACAGGHNVARVQARYEGVPTCRAAHLVGGAGKGCAWGCLGFGDCADVCSFDAIRMAKHGLPVVNLERCTACGDCVRVCPRDLFSIQPVSHRLWVACKSLAKGEEAEAECAVACTGCGLCALDAKAGVIEMVNNLAVVNYEKNEKASADAIQRCPTGAIVWIDEKQGVVKGAAAKVVTRTSPLPVVRTA